MKPDCVHCRERFSEYLDGALTAPQRDDVAGHLSGCVECRRALDLWRATMRAVAELPRRGAPEGFGARLMERLEPQRRRAPARRRLPVPWARALPVAAMFLLVFGVVFTVQRNGVFDRDRAPVRTVAMRAPAAAPAPMAAPVRGVPVAEEAASSEAPVPALGTALRMRMDAPEPGYRGAAPRPEEEASHEGMARGLEMAGVRGREGGVAGRATDAVSELRAMKSEPTRFAVLAREAARRGGADVLMFRQTVAPAEAVEPPQQVLTMSVKDPVDLVRRAVATVNEQGLEVTLALKPNHEADISVQVPVDRYDTLVAALAGLTNPQSQRLANTLYARGDFYRVAIANYDAILEGQEGGIKEEEDALDTRLEDRIENRRADRAQFGAMTRAASRPSAPMTAGQKVRERLEGPSLVNLQVSIRRAPPEPTRP